MSSRVGPGQAHHSAAGPRRASCAARGPCDASVRFTTPGSAGPPSGGPTSRSGSGPDRATHGESDRPPCGVLLAATLKAARRRFRASGATASKIHRACCWGTGPQQCRPICFDPIVCTHRRPSARPSQDPTTRSSPAHTRLSPQHAASSMHGRRSQAPAHSAAARQRTQRTAEVQRRQLRHPSETRCQRRCPSCFDPIVCTHRRPSARPSQNPPPPATATRTTAPARSTQHHPSSMHCRHRIPHLLNLIIM